MIVVADASPLIALARIGRLELLREVFGTLLLPDAVWREVVESGVGRAGADAVLHADWIERRSVADGALVAALRCDLGAGEAEAIVLARETGAALVLMDERHGPGRREASGSAGDGPGRCADRGTGARIAGRCRVSGRGLAAKGGLLAVGGTPADGHRAVRPEGEDGLSPTPAWQKNRWEGETR